LSYSQNWEGLPTILSEQETAANMHVRSCVKIYRDMQRSFSQTRFSKGLGMACKTAEEQMINRYDHIRCHLFKLLPLIEHDEMLYATGCGRSYGVGLVHGRCVKPKTRTSLNKISEDELEKSLEVARTRSKSFHAREAFTGLLSVMGSRAEINWLEAYEEENDNERQYTHNMFTSKLVDPTSVFRVAFTRDDAHPLPASLVVTYRATFREAIAQMDNGGPFKLKRKSWFHATQRQFAFQDIQVKPKSTRQNRTSGHKLKPEPELGQLLRSDMKVLIVDAYMSLSPRDVARQHGLSAIVQAELAATLRRAKALGQAVVFAVGSTDPHTLAEKVYLKQHFAEYGLRCGYLRSRSSPAHVWDREQHSMNDRVLLGLQMP